MTPLDQEVGRLVAQARESRGLTQAQFAAALKVSKRRITSIENGHQGWPLDRLVDVAQVLRVPLRNLIPARLMGAPAPANPEIDALTSAYDRSKGDLREVITTALDLIEARLRGGGRG